MRSLHVFLALALTAGAVRSVRVKNDALAALGNFSTGLEPELQDDKAWAGARSSQHFWVVAVVTYALLVCLVFFGAQRMFGKDVQPKPVDGTSVETAAEIEDSSAEDSDEELVENSRTDSSRLTMKTTMLGKDASEKRQKEKERRRAYKSQWLRASHDQHLKEGALTLSAVTPIMICFHLIRMLLWPASLPMSGIVSVIEFSTLLFVLAGAIYCVKRPSDCAYWPLFAFYCIYIPAVNLPPFQWSCKDLENAAASNDPWADWHLTEAKRDMDCSLQGVTAQELFMASILALPWLVPRQKMLKTFGFLWILGVYVPWTFAYSKFIGEQILSRQEHVLRLLILAVTLMMAWLQKFYLEKNARNNFVMVFRLREAGKKMYHILSYMLPNHVIVPMLENPDNVIAEHLPRVSILFIVIAEFDEFARRSTPKDLLQFLNEQFTKFDQLCAEHGVTKIETVGEEYVCCVGAAPEEQALDHKEILHRLFTVASRILQLHSTDSNGTEVRVKMGIHTGPIVAGVIGKKLPRYRLFGDTINTSARMMQKSEVGKLQFGEETFKDLPSTVEYIERGMIEMKGKGLVKTYFFDQIAEKRESNSHKPLADQRKSLCAILSHADIGESQLPGEEDVDSQLGEIAQREVKDFEEVLQQVTMKDFTPEMEREWYEDYHKKTMCKKFAGRLNRFLFALLMVSALEGVYMLWEGVRYSGFKFQYFFALRALSVIILLFWRTVIAPREMLLNSPFLVQSGLIASSIAILLLVWFSYEALTTKENSAKHRSTSLGAANVYDAPFDQVFVLNFVLIYYAASGLQHFLFKSSLIFVVLAIGLCILSDARGELGLDFPLFGKALFVTIALSSSFHTWQAEKGSRERFRAWREVQSFKVRIENILNTLMPRQVVKELKSLPMNAPPPSHQYQHATIAQSDLCGFTKLASTKTPQEVVQLIGALFGAFDTLTDKHDVYKVETVGDAYIAGQAESTLTANKSPVSVILFGMDMVKAVDEWASLNKVSVRCRVGIHHGACIGGIVGNDMQRYHLFGDLMSGVEVLESTAPEGAVQVSCACKSAVEDHFRSQSPLADSEELKFDAFVFEERPEPELKTSKGEVHAYAEVGGKTFIVSLTIS